MIVLIEIVAPIFGVVLCGYLMALTPALSVEGIRGLSNFVFYAAIPALLFATMAHAALPGGADLLLIAAYLAASVVAFAASLAAGWVLYRDSLAARSVMAMGAAFSNTVQLGIPLAFQAFGPAGLRQHMLIVSVHSAVMISLPTVIIEASREGGRPGRSLKLAARSIVTNPVLVAIAAGLAWSAVGWPLPGPVESWLRLLGGASTSCALFAMGASMARFKLGGNLGESAVITLFKLLLMPATAFLLARYVFALEPLAVAVCTLCAALPSGVNVFILAQRYDLCVERSVNLIVLSTLASLLTLSALLAVFAVR